MNRRLILAPIAAAAVAAALAAAANAQPADRAPGGHPPGMPDMAQMKVMHEQMMKQHMEDLKTILRLRPDQEPALAAFMAGHEPRRMEFHGPPNGPGDGPPKAETTPERLEHMAKRDAEEAAEHAKHREALARFYAALSPEQQKVFDALQRMHGGPHDGPGGPGLHRMIIHHGPGGPGGPMMMMHEPPR